MINQQLFPSFDKLYQQIEENTQKLKETVWLDEAKRKFLDPFQTIVNFAIENPNYSTKYTNTQAAVITITIPRKLEELFLTAKFLRQNLLDISGAVQGSNFVAETKFRENGYHFPPHVEVDESAGQAKIILHKKNITRSSDN